MKDFSFFLFLFSILYTSSISAKTFQLRFTGKSESEISNTSRKTIARELDYKMINSKAFCPGHSFAKRVGQWSCNKANECKATIKCHLITKSQNRKISLDFLGEVTPAKTPYRIYVTKRPLVTLSKKINKTKKTVLPKQAPLVFEEGKATFELFNDDALLEEGQSDSSEGNVVSIDTNDLPEEDNEEDSKNDKKDEDDGEVAELDDQKVEDKNEEVSENEAESTSPKSSDTGLQMLHFSLQAVTATLDNSGESESLGPSLGFRWHPQYFFSKNFSVGADISLNNFSLDVLGRDIGIRVLGYGIFGKYFFNKNLYGVLGYGVESWSSGDAELSSSSFSKLTYGAGYKFSNKAIGYLDSVELVGASLTGETEGVNASHFKLSFNISFY